MKEKLAKIKSELNELSQEVEAVENDENKLMNTEEELNFLFSKSNHFFQKLKYEFNMGSMNLFIHDMENELNHHKRKSFQTIEGEIHYIHKKGIYWKKKRKSYNKK